MEDYQDNLTDIRELINLAVKNRKAGQLENAKHFYQKVLQIDPEHTESLFNLGIIENTLGNIDQAGYYFKKVTLLKPDWLEAHFYLGYILLQNENIKEAEISLKKVIFLNPNYPIAYNLLGFISQRENKNSQAIEFYNRAISLKPDYAEACNNLGNVLLSMGRTEEAINNLQRAVQLKNNFEEPVYTLANIFSELHQSELAIHYYNRAISLKPDFAEPYYKLGNIYLELEKFQEAKINFKQAVYLNPRFSEAYNNLGNIFLNENNFSEAEFNLRQALKINPGMSGPYNNLGNLYVSQDKLQEAEYCYRQAILLLPGYAEAYYNLGNILLDQRKLAEAEINYNKAISLKPDYPEPYNNLGNIFFSQKKISDAIRSYHKAIELKPDYSGAYFNLGGALLSISKLDDAMFNFKKAIEINPDYSDAYTNLGNVLLAQGKVNEAIEHYQKALKIKPDCFTSNSNLLLALQYKDNLSDGEWQSFLMKFSDECKKIIPEIKQSKKDRNPDKKLKIGYVSPDFRIHSCAWFIEPLFANHDKEKFEIFCYSVLENPDSFTEKFKKLADVWHDTEDLTNKELIELIQNDGIDILVDLAGHTANNRLAIFAGKPAPVQVSWLGFPASTGLDTIDYKLSDKWLAPENSTEYFSEKVWRLNRVMHCYQAPDPSPPVSTLPYNTNGYITFASFNNLTKITEKTVEIWAKVLDEVSGSILILKANQSAAVELQDKISGLFIDHGISSERIKFVNPLPNTYDHLNYYNQVDIGLDTFPYNGATTTVEALWMGVPVISMAGERAASRYGLAFLSAVGLPELATGNSDEFIKTAVALANNPETLDKLRSSLREKLLNSQLCDRTGFTKEIENAYQEMWKNR
jgi:protein O-GlcNAc transferase